MFNTAVLESIEQNKQTQPKQGDEPWYVTKAREQGLPDAQITVNDKRFSNEVSSDTSQFNAAPAGSPLHGATDLSGRAISALEAARMPATDILLTWDGVPMRASAAEALGLIARLPDGTIVDRTGQQPTQQQPAPVDTLKTEAQTPILDEVAAADVGKAADALQQHGFSPDQVVARAFIEGIVDPLALDAIASGLNVNTDTALTWISDAGKHLIGSVADAIQTQGHSEVEALQLIHDACAADPAKFSQAALASWMSGSVTTVLQRVAEHIEREQAFGKLTQ